MRKALVLTVITILSLSYSRALAQTPTHSEEEMLRKLREIHVIVMEVRADIAKLKEAIEEKESNEEDAAVSGFGSFFQARKADPAKLRKIKLPDDPSEDQIGDYIQDIVAASRGQRSFSSEDPQVRMLVKIGPKHLKLLIEAIGGPRGIHGFGGGYHVQEAILRLAREEHKELILEALPERTFLVKVVLNNGWERDAKDVLLTELASAPQQLPHGWIQAVVNLNDPKTYADLKWYLINRDGRYNTFQAIQHLPGIDLEETVAKAWEKTGHHEWEERGIAKIAIQYGHVDALEYLVNFLGDEHKNRWEVAGIRQLVMRHLNFYGSNREIAEWLKKNADQLVFDKKTRKFIVAHGGKAPDQKDTTGQQHPQPANTADR